MESSKLGKPPKVTEMSMIAVRALKASSTQRRKMPLRTIEEKIAGQNLTPSDVRVIRAELRESGYSASAITKFMRELRSGTYSIGYVTVSKILTGKIVKTREEYDRMLANSRVHSSPFVFKSPATSSRGSSTRENETGDWRGNTARAMMLSR